MIGISSILTVWESSYTTSSNLTPLTPISGPGPTPSRLNTFGQKIMETRRLASSHGFVGKMLVLQVGLCIHIFPGWRLFIMRIAKKMPVVFLPKYMVFFFKKIHFENISFDSVTDLCGWNRELRLQAIRQWPLSWPKSSDLRRKKMLNPIPWNPRCFSRESHTELE